MITRPTNRHRKPHSLRADALVDADGGETQIESMTKDQSPFPHDESYSYDAFDRTGEIFDGDQVLKVTQPNEILNESL